MSVVTCAAASTAWNGSESSFELRLPLPGRQDDSAYCNKFSLQSRKRDSECMEKHRTIRLASVGGVLFALFAGASFPSTLPLLFFLTGLVVHLASGIHIDAGAASENCCRACHSLCLLVPLISEDTPSRKLYLSRRPRHQRSLYCKYSPAKTCSWEVVAFLDMVAWRNMPSGRDAAFMQRLQGLAREAMTWPFLEDRQRLKWAAVIKFGVVPIEEPAAEGC